MENMVEKKAFWANYSISKPAPIIEVRKFSHFDFRGKHKNY